MPPPRAVFRAQNAYPIPCLFCTSRFLLRLFAYQRIHVKKARSTPRKYQVTGYKFKAHNQTVGRSQTTAQQYNESLNPATDGCRAEGCPPTWTTRGEDEVREFILYNQDRRGLWREIVLHIRESEERASGRFSPYGVLLGRWNRLERLMPDTAHWRTADREGCLSSTVSRRYARLCFLRFFMSDSS